MRKVSRKIMFADIIITDNSALRITVIFKFWQFPDLKDRCGKGDEKLHVGDTICCTGVWDGDKAFLAADYKFTQRWSQTDVGGSQSFTPRPPKASKSSGGNGKHVICKFFVNTGRCDVANCPYTHDQSTITTSRKQFVEEKVARRMLAHENHFPRDQIESASKRAALFARWIVDTYGRAYLDSGLILDVAGGRGDLSFELAVKAGLKCRVVDPRPRKLKRWQRKLLKRDETAAVPAALPVHYEALFDEEFFSKHNLDPTTVRLITGMHPDEATEPIVNTALHHSLPFAVVPCCVFSALFPDRRLASTGVAPTTYPQFCAYLTEKSDNIQSTHIPFVGRNTVLYTLQQQPL